MTALELTGFALMLFGLVGTVLPLLPGAPMVFVGALLIAWAKDFTEIGWPTLTAVGLLAVITIAVDFVATALGAKKVGASSLAVFGSIVGTFLGFFGGFAGILIGPFIGAVAGELIARRDLEQAWKVGIGTWLGLILGGAVKVALVLIMIGITIFGYLY